MPSLSDSRATAAAGAAGTSSGTNPSHGSVHSCTAAPSTFLLSRNLRTSSSSPGVSMKNLISSARPISRSEEHTSELQSQSNLVCRLLLEKKKKNIEQFTIFTPAATVNNNSSACV